MHVDRVSRAKDNIFHGEINCRDSTEFTMQMFASLIPKRYLTVIVILILPITIPPRLPFHYRAGWPEEAIFRVRIAARS